MVAPSQLSADSDLADVFGAVGQGKISREPSRGTTMDDSELIRRISELAEEEHQLERSHAGEGLSPGEMERLRTLEVALDQCWDVLRQRRARRKVGQDPDDAVIRPSEVVEGYQQ